MLLNLVVSMAVLLASQAQPAAPKPPMAELEALSWMAGSWGGESDGVTMEEQWLLPRGGMMLGVHRDVKAGKAVSFEFLRIQKEADGLVYWASPKGRPATPFRLSEASATRVVFSNPEHDFPQRILYWTTPDGALHARIEGRLQGKDESEEWAWKRLPR